MNTELNNPENIDNNQINDVGHKLNGDDFRKSPRFKELEKLLTCKCCNQILMEPVTLFCQHTYCQSCLIINNANTENTATFTCMECKKNMIIPVSSNFQLRGIIDKIYDTEYFEDRKQQFTNLLAKDLKLKRKYDIYKEKLNSIVNKVTETNGKFNIGVSYINANNLFI